MAIKSKLEYNDNGDRIPGLREIGPAQAEIVRWIFEQYANGSAPAAIALNLNERRVPAPQENYWRDDTIRGDGKRRSGILHNELYIGRLVWNRRQYRKNPDTGRRAARHDSDDQWVVNENANLRIISDALLARVKARQAEVGELFTHTTTNRLNASHRPSYRLSGILESTECGGPYTILAKTGTAAQITRSRSR
ncbi:recombinase family protein [Agrobacterium sp. T29]|uniref:recombinase family protein n=1 Tax=Agrobacterium sp. T29 TaxID=2580515 RepID=UPI00115E2788|nr:recombinase family protein [Agrobacterium sp. T29]